MFIGQLSDYDDGRGANNAVFNAARHNREGSSIVERVLEELPITEFRFVNCGRHAAVFDIGDGLVIRISLGEGERIDSEVVIQPYFSAHSGNYMVEILPKLQESPSSDILIELKNCIAALGYREKDNVSARCNVGHKTIPGFGDVAFVYDADAIAKSWKPSSKVGCHTDYNLAQVALKNDILARMNNAGLRNMLV